MLFLNTVINNVPKGERSIIIYHEVMSIYMMHDFGQSAETYIHPLQTQPESNEQHTATTNIILGNGPKSDATSPEPFP